jgi:sodium/pantothenate symporter
MDIYTTTIAISIVVYIAIGSYAGRGVKRLDDYYVAGRRAPRLIIVGTLVGFSASNDIGIHKSRDEKKRLHFSRLMMLVIGTIARSREIWRPH